ncbi:hypothetical protein Rsub_02521 [Raphidocelis subcapitata]|uniref:DEX1 C-terminal domain-containing protein n=1 Tax=Raphidocelis subcapitata TaxID=307507 RepID=A0A2V0NY14_9CHLO|nr:hypothetical protein Rsub_02521 [Raphidocelis subcapitata]|eukprot:GBF89817.1 hypothetical protein Rsub_02521 [Raphidocelis subcapitata]
MRGSHGPGASAARRRPARAAPLAAATLLLALLLAPRAAAQLSGGRAHDSQWHASESKFLQRRAENDAEEPGGFDDTAGECPLDVELRWMTQVSSSVYATPLVTDLFSDGRRDVVVPGFVHHMDALQGTDGAQSLGWPAFHASTVHASPLLFDWDLDGTPDVLLATYDGEVMAFKDTGEQLLGRLHINRLAVRRKWFVGIDPDPVDHSHPDVGGAGIPFEPPTAARRHGKSIRPHRPPAPPAAAGSPPPAAGGAPRPAPPQRRRRLMAAPGEAGGGGGGGSSSGGGGGGGGGAPGVEFDASKQGLSQEALDSLKVFEDGPAASGAAAGGPAAARQGEGIGGRPLIEPAEPGDAAPHGGSGGGGGGGGGGAPAAFDELGDRLPAAAGEAEAAEAAGEGEGAGYDVVGGVGADYMPNWGWGEEAFHQDKPAPTESEWVYVDPHVLCTPAIGDIDGDGREDIVIAVSYFYDPDYYDDPAHARELGDTDKSKYLGGGVVAFDLHTRAIKWAQHLDLTTDSTAFKAHMFSAPTLADIDRDGKLEIIVGTSVGFVYVLDCWGTPKRGWPIQMGEVQGQVLAVDANGDGWLEIFAGDSLGNVALFDRSGKELWERHLKSMVSQGAAAADLDGDGRLELVVATADGRVHALRGHDGTPIPNFPFRTGGRIQAPPVVLSLHAPPPPGRAPPTHQHAAVMSFDGALYLIDGVTGCAHTVDIGEASYSAVLADDVDGSGTLDLIVSTMNGNASNGQVARWGYFGAFATPASRAPRDVAGQSLRVSIEVLDRRASLTPSGAPLNASRGGPYNVTVLLRGVGVGEMNAGPAPVIGVADALPNGGPHVLEIPCPRTRTTATVRVEVTDENRLSYVDEFPLSFNVHFHKLLKYLVALPLLAMAAVALAVAAPYLGEDEEGYGLAAAAPSRRYDLAS